MFYTYAIIEIQKLEKKIELLNRQISKFPEGKLVCSKNRAHWKWYKSDGHKKVYIPKKEKKFAESLACKKYLELQLENAVHEKNAINYYLRHHNSNAISSEIDFINSPKYQELLEQKFVPLSSELAVWQNFHYERKKKYAEGLTHKAASGNYVRSKSEALIDLYLFKNKIPFHYEEALYLNGDVLFPDFTIRHPQTGEFFYWEHFGRMDDPAYNKTVGIKLQMYISNGIIPGINLITTYETKDHPLTAQMIEDILKRFFVETGELF